MESNYILSWFKRACSPSLFKIALKTHFKPSKNYSSLLIVANKSSFVGDFLSVRESVFTVERI